MEKVRLFLLTFLLLGVTAIAYGQNIQVSGVVTDASTGEGIPYASVVVKGTTTGTASDVNGAYSISVPRGGVLVFSTIGYTSQELTVGSSATLNVKLEPDSEFLEETVVVGYGSAKSVKSLVGSIQTVNSEKLKNAPSSSALDQLQGQVAGLQVLSYSGVAGDNAVSMTLHGVGSIGNTSSAPLYVIDGIPSSSRSIMAMNPNDIESVSILKDAAATSIYGSRASNGVVFITTKTGAYNESASVTVRSQYGISTLANTNLYENMMSGDELMDFWVRSGLHTEQWVQTNFLDRGYTYNTEWYKVMMNMNNPQLQNDINIRGGGRKVAYNISASQFSQQGFTPGNYYDRYTLRSNVQGHPLDWLKFGTNLNFSLDKTQANPNWGSAAVGMSNYTSGGLSFLLVPLYPVYDENGKLYEETFPGSNQKNPYYYMENHMDRYDRYGVNGNVFLELSPIKNLKIMSRAGVDGYITLDNWSTTPSYVAKYGGTATAGKSSAFNYQATITNTIEYNWEINPNHKLSFLAGQEGVANNYNYFYARSQKQTDDRLMLLQQGQQSTYAMSESDSQSRFLSFFGRVDYSLLDKYFFDVVVRNDAVSRFGIDRRNAQFWSAGVRWNIKNEDFMRDIQAVDALDFKLSYGTQGNAATDSDYPALGIIGSSGKYAEAVGTALNQPANPQLSWEQQALFTAALSGRAINLIDFTLEFYNRKTTNMLMDVPNPYTSGFNETSKNVGTMSNTGVDITLGFDIIKQRDAFLRFNTTFTYNSQKIIELFDGRERWEIANTNVAYVVGKPVMFYTPLYAGIDPEDGKQMWYVPGENRDITTMNETTKVFDDASLSQNSGHARYAPINGGFSFSGGWKGLSLQADFAYVIGKYLISNDGYFYGNPANFNTMNTHKAMSDFWTPDNRDAKYPDWGSGAVMQFDSHLLENATFLRLKNLQIGYALPKAALNWSNGVLKEVKITATGRNLLTFTKYTGIDPEINSNLTYGVAGNSKQILGGIEITF